MKRFNRLWALLLAFALMITYMPATAFAVGDEGGSKAVKTFVCECGHYYMGQEVGYTLGYEEGDTLTIDDDEYIYRQYGDYEGGFFLNGVIDTYPNGEYKCLVPNSVDEEAVYNETTANVKSEILAPLSEDGDGSWGVFATGTIKATAYPKPMSLTYIGEDIIYYIWDDLVEVDTSSFRTNGNEIIVHYSDGTNESYIFREFYDDDDLLGEGYYLDGEVSLDENGAPLDDGEDFDLDIPEEGIAEGTTTLNFYLWNYAYGSELLDVCGEVAIRKAAEVTHFEYTGDPLYYYDNESYDGEQDIDIESPGNIITLYYDNGTSEDYICTAYYDEEEEYTYYYYVLNGEIVDEDGYIENSITPSCTYTKGDAKAKIYLEEYDLYTDVDISKAPKPRFATYDGCTLHYYPGGDSVEGLYTENNKIIITYDDGNTAKYICKQSEAWDGYYFFLNGDTEADSLDIYVDEGNFEVGTETIRFVIDMTYGEEPLVIHGDFPVSPGPAPEKVEFIPGDEDFVVESLVGKYSIDERSFEGEGNKFVVTYTDGSTKEYIWLPDTEENTGELFYLNGDYYETNFTIRTTETELEDGVQKGTHDVTFVYRQNVEINGEEKEVSVPMIYPVTATKQFTYLEFSNVNCPYTGKTVKPAAKLYRYDGKLLATKIYTVDYPKAVKVGYYNAAPKITSTFAGVYGTDYDSIGWFRIVPKKEAISKLTAGKKSFTVSWSKFAWQQATGYQIQYALNSKFTKSKKTVTVTSYKTTKKTINKLKGKKKYYVRVRAYKTVDGEKLYGPWSKAKYVTTKW